jgi:hypothetical protein
LDPLIGTAFRASQQEWDRAQAQWLRIGPRSPVGFPILDFGNQVNHRRGQICPFPMGIIRPDNQFATELSTLLVLPSGRSVGTASIQTGRLLVRLPIRFF